MWKVHEHVLYLCFQCFCEHYIVLLKTAVALY